MSGWRPRDSYVWFVLGLGVLGERCSLSRDDNGGVGGTIETCSDGSVDTS